MTVIRCTRVSTDKNDLSNKGVSIVFVRQRELSTTGPLSNLLLAICNYFAGEERGYISICTMQRLAAAELERKRVDLRVLDQNINTADATGRLLFNMLGAIAQFETELSAERQKDGIHKAKGRGVQFGKRKKLSPEQIAELQQRRQEGVLIKALMKEYDLSKSSVYRYLNETVPFPDSVSLFLD